MKNFAFVFPGQGSQAVGMLDAWGDHSVVRETLAEASEALGEDVGRLIQEGPADVLIPFMVHKLQAAVTVIGTVARSGLSGTLIGNTAEVVLDAVESDVLVLKPETVMDHLEEMVAQH